MAKTGRAELEAPAPIIPQPNLNGRAWPPPAEELAKLHDDQVRFPGKYAARTASWLFVPLFGSAMGQQALFPYFPLNDREIQTLILRIQQYLPRIQWTWQMTRATFDERFAGYYFDAEIQNQIRSDIESVDAGGNRLIQSIDALGSRMAGQAIRELEAQKVSCMVIVV